MTQDKDVLLEFINLAQKLREKNPLVFIETKGYLKGLLYQQNLQNNENKKVINQ